MSESPALPGCVLGVDYGQKRIGLALSDPGRRIASPLELRRRGTAEQDVQFFLHLVKSREVCLIAVGLPVHAGGEEGQKAREARDYGAWLGQVTGLPVRFWDERFTTVEAEELLRGAGLTAKRRRDRRDKVAAQIMLQSFLDAGCPESPGDMAL